MLKLGANETMERSKSTHPLHKGRIPYTLCPLIGVNVTVSYVSRQELKQLMKSA